MALYLLDTNILSAALRDPRGATAQRLAAEPVESLCTSIIVSAELRFGAEKKGSPTLSERVNQLLGAVEVLPFGLGADRCYAQVRAELEKKGALIGANDMLIAAHALALDATLVTDNVGEFRRVRELRIENWLER